LLFCTDGVTDKVDFVEIADLMRTTPIRSIAPQLVRLANERNTSDNATALAIEVMQEPYVEDTWEAKAEPRVYVGNSPLRSLKLDKPKTLDTDPGATQSPGCVLVLIIVVIIAIIWGISRLTTGQAGDGLAPPANPASISVDGEAASGTPL